MAAGGVEVGNGGFGMPEHICDREPASSAPRPLCVHVVWTDGSYSKTPRATEAISKRPVKPGTESEKEWERRTKRCWKAFHFSITMATNQKPQEALLDFKLSVTSKSNSASRSVRNWIDLLLIVSSFGVPVCSVELFTLLKLCSIHCHSIPQDATWLQIQSTRKQSVKMTFDCQLPFALTSWCSIKRLNRLYN